MGSQSPPSFRTSLQILTLPFLFRAKAALHFSKKIMLKLTSWQELQCTS